MKDIFVEKLNNKLKILLFLLFMLFLSKYNEKRIFDEE